jgi:Abnormal spindle-like microcephaly-assoc'd, ASPM-SPD-2-Hydin
VKQVPRSSGISSGFRVFVIFSAILALISTAMAGSGQLTSSPSDVNFGSVQVGSSQTQSVTLTNVGTSSLIITQATPSLAVFTLTGLSYPVTLSAGKSVSCNVTFSPQSAVTSSGSIAIKFHNRHNTSATYTLTVPVSGTGVTAGQVTSTPTSLGFGSVTVGSKPSLSETVTNAGGSNVTISQVGISGTGFSLRGITPPVTLTPGQNTTFALIFAPTSAGTFPGTVTVTSNASNPSLAIPLSGTAVAPATLTASPTSLTYTNITVGQTSSQTETIKNTGGTSTTVSAVAESGTGFTVSGITPPVTLTAGQSTTFTVKFAPTSAGTFTGTATVTSNASNPSLSIPLSGTAVASVAGTLTAVPTTVAVPGSIVVGASGTATGRLSATTASVTVSGVSVVGSEFVISGLAFPVTIPAGSSATYNITFSPTSSGSASTTASFASNASNAPSGVSLTGTAVAAPVYAVGLTWTASGSTGVMGYYVYRALYNTSTSTCGSYTKLNPASPNTTTTYTDSGITDGDTYCYQVTAVNSSGEQSTDSNMATAIIPAP